ncbi:MAG TPA: glycoside hydrolase family 127 protein [Bryobacteraceae bacterium]|nr:glycoside hydrolase family 127 protein [Bryobacteraceae bacterium]
MLAGSAALIAYRPMQAEAAAPDKPQPLRPAHDYPVEPVPFTAVHVDDVFWAPRIETNRKVTIPFAFHKCEETGRVANFVRAAAVMRGDTSDRTLPGYPFDDTDVYKVIEGASYTLRVQYDAKLDAYVDSLIVKIAAAQEPDGYLYTARTIDPEHPHKWAGKERWVQEEVLSHELYNLGHLYESATAHYQATGKRSMLDISIKSANLLCNTFGPGKRSIYPGHQIVEMGLVKLYRVTGDERYLGLAKFMLDARGPGGKAYNQADLKVVDQREAVGHAVRATYMYSGMADVAAMTGDTAYVTAIDAIWENVASKKLYLTGGIGARKEGEAFGDNFELPNLTAYNETCAAVGNDYWNHRLFLLHADAKYIDVMERTLYNGLISGVSLDGKSFFYPNPLESIGGYDRSPWFGVACCPGNITRFMASVPGYMYAQRGDTVYVNLYAAGKAQIKMQNRSVAIVQETRYPWDGNIKMTVDPGSGGNFSINVRIPGWARGEAVPGNLYRFADAIAEPPSLKVNGRPAELALEKGYVRLARNWKRGDVIELELPMPVRRVIATEEVEADRGRVALQRGPIVYCTESPDNPKESVIEMALAREAKFATEYRPDMLNGTVVIKGVAAHQASDGTTVAEKEFTAVPYHAWANRGDSKMLVWMQDRGATAGQPSA